MKSHDPNRDISPIVYNPTYRLQYHPVQISMLIFSSHLLLNTLLTAA